MRAFLLAAGEGTRLSPITDTIPKSLVPVCGKPILEWWIDLFARYEINDILINTHTFPGAVKEVLYKNNESWEVTYEEELLGSAGTLRDNKSFVRGEKDFLIAYVDVLTNCNLRKIQEFHRQKKADITIVASRVPEPEGKGILEVNAGRVVTFEEKPTAPKSNLANMGIYVCKPFVLDLIPSDKYVDWASFISQIIGKVSVFVYESNEYFCDIGTHENLKQANEQWSKLYGI